MGKDAQVLERHRLRTRPKIRSSIVAMSKLFPAPAKVLDVGSEDGYANEVFAELGYDVVSTDVRPLGPKVIRDDIMNTKLSVGFDIVYGRHVLEHVKPTKRFLRKCFRLLKKRWTCFFCFST